VTVASAGIRKTPSGRYKVWWRLDDGSQGSQTLDSRDQARDYMHELLAGVARDTWVDPRRGKQPFGDWARQWWETWSSDPDRSPTTLEATEARFRLHVLPYFEHRQLRSITVTVVRRWQNDLKAARGRGTIMAARSILYRILQAAEDERLIVANPVAKVPAPKPEVDPDELLGEGKRRALTPEEAGQLLARVPPIWWDHIVTLLGTGLRFGELGGLRRRRVLLDREPPVIQVVTTRYQAGKIRQWLQGPTQEPGWHPYHSPRPPGRRGRSTPTPAGHRQRRPCLCRSLGAGCRSSAALPLPVPARLPRRSGPPHRSH
jgi:hypothetical protein